MSGEADLEIEPLLNVLFGELFAQPCGVGRRACMHGIVFGCRSCALCISGFSDAVLFLHATERREAAIRDFLNNVLKSGIYDARARGLLKQFGLLLDLTRWDISTIPLSLPSLLSAHFSFLASSLPPLPSSQ